MNDLTRNSFYPDFIKSGGHITSFDDFLLTQALKQNQLSPVGWGYWIHRLQRGKTPSNECLRHDNKLSDDETPALDFWGIWSTLSLQLLPSPFWPGVVVYDGVQSMGQIELFEI